MSIMPLQYPGYTVPQAGPSPLAALGEGFGQGFEKGRKNLKTREGLEAAKAAYARAGNAPRPSLASLGGMAPAANGAAPVMPVTRGGALGPIGSPGGGDIYNQFIGGVRSGGLTNPYGLAAVASTGYAESGYKPEHAYGQWADPSQSGQAGTAGGILSWRADRLNNLRSFASAKGDDPNRPSAETQAAFFLQEDPTLVSALQNAKSVDEAQRYINGAWKFAGYNEAGNAEVNRRLAMAQSYLANDFGGGAGGGAPASAAEAVTAMGQGGRPIGDGAPYLRYDNQGATRNQQLSPELTGALSFLPELGVTAEVFSGGQPSAEEGGARTGSTRHDHGNAADIRLYGPDGRQLDWANPQDRPVFEEVVRRGKAAGLTGFGAGPGYMGQGTMHVGFGTPGVWGAGGSSANAPEWLANAYNGAPAGTAPSAGPVQVAEAGGPPQALIDAALGNGGGLQVTPDELVALLQGEETRGLGMKLWEAQVTGSQQAAGEALNLWFKMDARNRDIADQQYDRGLRYEDRAWALDDAERERAQKLTDAQRTREEGIQDYRTKQEIDQEFAAPEKPPASVQEYNFYADQERAAGRQPLSYNQWDLQSTKAGASNVTVNTGSDSSQFYKTADENRAKTFVGLSDAGLDAQRSGLQIDQLEGILSNVETGGLAALKQWAGEYGIETSGLSDIQAATALINRMVPAQRAPGSGSMSDADLALFRQSIPRIINQPGGNALIIQTMRGIGNYDAQIGAIADRVLNREITPEEGRRMMAQVQNPLARFREASREVPQAAPQAPAEGPSRPTTDAEYDALPSGALFVDPDDGQTYRKP